MKKIFFPVFILFGIISLSGNPYAQKRLTNREFEMLPDEKIETLSQPGKRIEVITGKPVALYNLNVNVNSNSPEKMAFQFLKENSELLKINSGIESIRFKNIVETPASYHVHFMQYIEGFPVYNSDINVTINRSNRVVFVMNGYKIPYGSKEKFKLLDQNINKESALQLAKNYLGVNNQIVYENVETMVYCNKGTFRLSQKVNIVPSEIVFGDWEIFVDANSGEIFRVEDKSCYNEGGKNKTTGVNGSGWVFDPDPITHATTIYGGTGFIDNNDADSDSLTAHLEVRDLIDITFDGSVYSLVSPYAQITDSESPFTGLHTSANSNFYFTRSNDNFEAVNTFFLIDQSMRYINLSLGIPLSPYQYVGGVKFDPHGLGGEDNSHYLPETGSVSFGDGGVDDAEDISVIIHELGHGIHDWLTNGNLSQVDGLSEGCGDYWAASYIRSTGYWISSDSAYNWVFNWDGHNPFWPGRITNYTSHYPDGLVEQIHTDGQMWASSLMSVYDLIGREPTDRNFLEALAMTNGSSNQQDAANAFIQSDQLNYGGTHLTDIFNVFIDRGYIEAEFAVDFTADITGGQAPLSVTFTDLSISINGPVISWEWDLDGDGNTDSFLQNPSWIYTDEGVYTISLTASDGTDTYTETKTAYISVNGGILVWEGVNNGANYSGTFIKNSLEDSGYTVTYSTSANLPSSMIGYDAVFLSFGNYGTDGTTLTELTDENANVIIEYLQAGGRVYLEGGDSFGYDQDDNPTLLGLFGLSSASDGTSGNHPVTNLQGQTGTLSSGVTFASSSQLQTTWIDIYTASPNGDVAFSESTVGNVAVQSVQGNARTFCFSYALGKLNDAGFPSTKANLIQEILYFFEIDIPIPVELTSFSASTQNNGVLLKWTTATELNNSGFEVERKQENSSWSKITFLQGNGTTSSQKEYSYLDWNLASGKYLYRLKQIDFDGSFEYSNIIEADINVPSKFELSQNYPNPFNPNTVISYSLPKAGNVSLKVYNVLGQEVSTLVNDIKDVGIHKIDFNAVGLNNGIYFYKLVTGNISQVKKMTFIK